jgi:hypothetical protein
MTTTINKIEVALIMDSIYELKEKIEKDVRGYDRKNLSSDSRKWIAELQDKYFDADALYHKLLRMDDTGLENEDLMFKEVPMDEAKVS